jgi:radical SAM superfamily enzyme YgiQ (UPF0313 family)
MHTVLRRNGVDARVLDLENEVGNPGASDRDVFLTNAQRHLEKALAALGDEPPMVVVSCSSSRQYAASVAIANLIRRLRQDARIAVVGFHVSARPDDFTFPGAVFDWVILGEPEMAVLEIAASGSVAGGLGGSEGAGRATAVAGRSGREDAGRATAVAGRRGSEGAGPTTGAALAESAAARSPVMIEGTPLEHASANLPDYESYPYTKHGLRVLQVYFSRGCPFPETACQLRPGSPGWRAFPPEAVKAEIDRLMALRPLRIDVLDPAFGLDPAWRSAALELLDRSEGRRPVPVRITTRPEVFTRRDADLAYKADLRLEINVGTLSVRLLNRTGAIPEPLKHVEETLDLLAYVNAKGLLADVDFVFNQPGETRKSAAETLDRLERFVEELPNTSLTVNAYSWVYVPYADIDTEIDVPRERYGTRILHPEWWREGIPSERAAKSVVASSEMAGLEAGAESYWRPRFQAIAERLAAKLTGDAQRGIRSHEWVGTGATGVPHGFWVEPRWH